MNRHQGNTILAKTLSIPLLFAVAITAVFAAQPLPVAANECPDDNQSKAGVAITPGWAEDYGVEDEDGNITHYCVPGLDEVDEVNVIMFYIREFIRLLSAGVGVVVTLMLVVGGVQYASSAGDAQKVESAKNKITHAVEALVLFIFMAAIINYIIPGGLL